MDSPLDDVEFLARSEHRVEVIAGLSGGSHDRNELRAATGASSPTIGRILGDFEARHWVVRDGHQYELTQLGAFVAERFVDLLSGMEIERTLRDVWQWLPREMDGFSVDLFADAVVSYPGPGYPYQPLARISELIEETETMCGFGTTVFKSGNLEVLCRNLLAGMELEYIYSPPILETVVAWNPEKIGEAVARDNCTILLHDDLPDLNRCGLGIFSDRIGICCHDPETKMLRAVIDTDAPEAREWAESVYERYQCEARPLESERSSEAQESPARTKST